MNVLSIGKIKILMLIVVGVLTKVVLILKTPQDPLGMRNEFVFRVFAKTKLNHFTFVLSKM
jgi:hypothetical protein